MASVDLEQPFANLYQVDLEQPFVNGQSVELEQPFSHLRQSELYQPFSHAQDLIVDLAQPFSNLAGNPFSVDLEQPFGHLNIVNLLQPFPMAADQSFSTDLQQPFSNLAGNPFSVDLLQPFVNSNPQFKSFFGVYGSNALTVSVNGRTIDIKTEPALSISQDEGSPYWQCQFELATVSDFGLFPLDQEFTINFYGTTYSFIVDTRPFRRSAGLRANEPQLQTGISGLSPLALLASPRAEQIPRTYDEDMSAQAIVEDLIGSVTWSIPNWIIPANRFGVSNQAPLEAAQQIVQAVGGVIQSTPSGSVIVRSLYPVKVPSYEGSEDFTLSDADISEISETISAQQYYNKFTLRDSDSEDNSAGQDRLEFIPDDNLELSGEIRAFPNPWRTNLQLTTTRNGVTIVAQGEVTNQITQEAVEIKEGRVSLTYPPLSIVSVVYLDANLGGVSFDGSELSTVIKEWSLANITYTYRYLSYRVTATSPIKAQFLLEEI